jgi:hypothetical protein
MENVFKKGDKVFHYLYKWGTVTNDYKINNSGDFYVEVKFDNSSQNYFQNFKDAFLLSFTEYTLEGFSQERPEPAPKLGDIVWGKGFHTTDWSIGHYLGRQHASYKISSTPNALSYWLAFTITTKNPYTNEQ